MSHMDHPRPARDTTHQCPARDCKARVSRSQLACPRHWAKVDRHTQRRVNAAYRSGDRDAHFAAMHDAIDEMNATPTPGAPA